MFERFGLDGFLQQPQQKISSCCCVGLAATAGGHLPGIGLLSELTT